MLCPNCGHTPPEGAVYCFRCGEKLPSAAPAAASFLGCPPSGSPIPAARPEQMPPETSHPKKKGTHWIPLTVMAVLCVLGLSLFFALPYDTTDEPAVSAASETPWFINDGGTLYFLDYLYTGPEELTVPDVVDGIPVEQIGEYCFAYCESITTVILPDSIRSIDSSAFAYCTAMRGIFLPEGITYIGSDAFYGCSSLEAVCIPSTVETIEPGAFDGCISLAYILYSGIHSHWKDLYSDYISLETQVYCTDGTFIHRKSFS